MRLPAVLFVQLLLVYATVSYGAENSKESPSVSTLTSYQLGDYTLELNTNDPSIKGVPDPSGLDNLRQETNRPWEEKILPFLGLKLSRPLPDNFWNFGQAPASATDSDIAHGLH
jgi:hypothetical protein